MAQMDRTARRGESIADLRALLHAALALFLLFVATTLAVYKPRGMTPYGHRKRRERREAFGR
jgi:hypothetical protein